MRDPKPRLELEATTLERGGRGIEVHDSVDEHRSLAFQVVGEQQPRLLIPQADLRDPRSERLDREHDLAAENVRVEGDIAGHVPAGHVEKVEGLEHQPAPRLTTNLADGARGAEMGDDCLP